MKDRLPSFLCSAFLFADGLRSATLLCGEAMGDLHAHGVVREIFGNRQGVSKACFDKRHIAEPTLRIKALSSLPSIQWQSGRASG